MPWHPKADETVAAPASHGPPAPPQRLVARERLTRLVDHASALTFVVAPAGSGKTVLAAEWVHRCGASGLDLHWLSPADPHGLVPALFSAAGVPESVEVAEAVARSHDPAARIELIVAELRSRLLSGAAPAPIVIDDAHRLPPGCIELLSGVLEAVPQAVRLVLLSRRDLPLGLVALDLAGRLLMVRAGQLCFDDDEATRLVLSHAPRASAADVVKLQEHTQGWAAALILAARALDAADDPRTAHLMMRSMEQQSVLDYLLSEALDGLSEHTRQVLMSVCHEPEVTAESAITLSAHHDAGRRLADLAREGLLVTAFPDGVGGGLVWRLHPLLLEALRRQSAHGTPKARREAHLRGAAFARAAGNPYDALRHAVLSGDEELLVAFLRELAPDLLAIGRADVIEDALRHLSPVRRSADPHLLGIEALCRIQADDIGEVLGLVAKAEAALAAADPGARPSSDPAGQLLRADLALLRLWRARLGWAEPGQAIAEARAVLESSGPSPVSTSRTCAIVLELGAAEAWQGDLEAAVRHTREALVMARSLGYTRLTVAALGQCALLDAACGATQSARAQAVECLQLQGDSGDDITTSRARLAMAWAEFQALDLAAAAANLERSRTPGAPLDPLGLVLSTVLDARLLLEHGQVQDAERVLAGPLVVPPPVPAFALALVSVSKAQLAAVTGDDVALAEEISFLDDLGCTTEAQLYSAIRRAYDGRVGEAIAALDELAGAPSPSLFMRSGVGAVRLALLLLAGETAAGRAALPHLLTTVATHRHLHVLTAALRARDDFLDSLRKEVRRTDAHPFAAEALAAMESYELAYPERHRPLLEAARATARAPARLVPHARDGTRHPPLVTTDLTPRESEVFEQLALGGSYGDIARALFVTENTVKTHLASIYRKLGVVRRAEALQVGRERGLLGFGVEPRTRQ